MIEEYCVVCGKKIAAANGTKHQKYCSKKCRDLIAKQRWKQREQRAKENDFARRKEESDKRLGYCMKEADRIGISYGEYMARREAGLYK